jgi:hypothetical protein
MDRSALLINLYQLPMAQAHLEQGMEEMAASCLPTLWRTSQYWEC